VIFLICNSRYIICIVIKKKRCCKFCKYFEVSILRFYFLNNLCLVREGFVAKNNFDDKALAVEAEVEAKNAENQAGEAEAEAFVCNMNKEWASEAQAWAQAEAAWLRSAEAWKKSVRLNTKLSKFFFFS
jgi:hypothetical protein